MAAHVEMNFSEEALIRDPKAGDVRALLHKGLEKYPQTKPVIELALGPEFFKSIERLRTDPV